MYYISLYTFLILNIIKHIEKIHHYEILCIIYDYILFYIYLLVVFNGRIHSVYVRGRLRFQPEAHGRLEALAAESARGLHLRRVPVLRERERS